MVLGFVVPFAQALTALDFLLCPMCSSPRERRKVARWLPARLPRKLAPSWHRTRPLSLAPAKLAGLRVEALATTRPAPLGVPAAGAADLLTGGGNRERSRQIRDRSHQQGRKFHPSDGA